MGGDRLADQLQRAIYQVVDRLKLLVTGDFLDGLAAFGLEYDEVLQEVEQVAGFQAQQILDRDFQRVIGVIGFRRVPPAFLFRVAGPPRPPAIEVLGDVVLAGVVEQHGAVAEFLLVRRHAKHVGGQQQRRLTLVAVQLLDGFSPVFATGEIAFVFGDDQRDAVDQQHRVGAALSRTLHPVLMGGGEVVEVLLGGVEFEEAHGFGRFTGRQDHGCAVAQQVESCAVGGELIRLA